MIRRIPRFLRRSVLVAVLLAVSVSVIQSWSSGSPGTAGWVQTQWGPLGPADRNLLVTVRLAGLWEGPTGQQAMQQASSTEVQEVGRVISTEHAALDEQVRKVADQLGVLLPTSPSAKQLAWMGEISEQNGSEYDRVFVQRLREAHGIVLPVIAEVRASTRNELIRSFAATADQFVSGHIQHLEGSGLVDYDALPEPPSPGLLSGNRSTQDLIVPILVFVAALLAALGLVAAMRHRHAERTQRTTITRPPPAATVKAIPGPRAPLDETIGPRRRVLVGSAVGESSGSHRRVAGTAPGETTGPRHAIRR